MPSIVTVNVSQTIPPTPSLLQQTGAFVSQGATTTSAGTATLLTGLSDLTPILAGALANTSLTWTSSVVTVTPAAPHGFTTGDIIELTIAGVTPNAYNGTFACTITGASTFTYPLVSNPGTETIPGTYTPEDVSELVAMATTFFAQGNAISVYVMEFGAGSPAQGVTALSAYITANPFEYYAWLLPRAWASESTYIAFVADYESTTSKVYFFTSMTIDNYTSFTPVMKCVVGNIESTGIPMTEFSLAAPFYCVLATNPSTTNKVAPFAFRFLFGVTAWPTKGNGAIFTELAAAGVNYVGSGAEGGISDAIWVYGTTMDSNDFEYWYSVDWVQINIDLNISNAVINGSNNPINPLYYNQDGINRLQSVAASTMSSGVTFGMVLGQIVQTTLDGPVLDANLNAGLYANQTVVNAVPFITYSAENPSDYKIGEYDGFAIVYIPARGFKHIVFNVNVTQFVNQ